jgi:2-C-methyl-D-erythritol 4-phosphate cytidylyltransferase/2-C-methyl-D-erythritol 2,4-cyclodiphosphate synthase
MGLPEPKQFVRLRGIPVLVRTVQCFLTAPDIDSIVIALPAERVESTRVLLHTFLSGDQLDRLVLVAGGKTRQDSVQAGLNALPPDTDIVLVHDGARPFVTPEIIQQCLDEAVRSGAAIAAVPVKDTIKRTGETGRITQTVDRGGLWQAQTPQAARLPLLRQAYEVARQEQFQGTDEASLLEKAGYAVSIVQGSEYNIKITRQNDLKIAERLLEESVLIKIGHGFDAHRFGLGRLLILGGVTISFDLGLEGHSDADVLTHALIDALLGAMGKGDIGGHFPDSDPQYKDISSLKLLEHVIGEMKAMHLSICNADITVICQRPKLSPFIAEMKDTIAVTCSISPDLVNIKATTTEMMGFTGRGEGIATHAVVLLQEGGRGGRPPCPGRLQ